MFSSRRFKLPDELSFGVQAESPATEQNAVDAATSEHINAVIFLFISYPFTEPPVTP